MPFGKLAALYLICAAAFFACDFVWLSTAVPRLYQPALGPLLRPKPDVAVATAFYLLYVVGLVALAVVPGIKEGAFVGALWRGALFGLIAYATYDLTNLSTLANWPVNITIIDMVWGLVLNSIVASVGFFAGTRLLHL
jgi:uncharacterized membrane protein